MLVNLKNFRTWKKKDCHNKALEKAKKFVMTFEDQTKAVTHDNYENDKYLKNLRILKLIIEAVLFGTRDRIPGPPRKIKLQRKLSRKKSEQRKLYCNNKRFCQTWYHLKRPFRKWSKKCKNSIMENPEWYNSLSSGVYKEENKGWYIRILCHNCRRSHWPIFKQRNFAFMLTLCNLPKWSSHNTRDIL